MESNDRHYDRGVERVIRRLKPKDLGALLNGSDEEPPLEPGSLSD